MTNLATSVNRDCYDYIICNDSSEQELFIHKHCFNTVNDSFQSWLVENREKYFRHQFC